MFKFLKHSGVTLLEILLVLVVVAFIIIMATRYFEQASFGMKVTKTTQIIHKVTEASFEWVKGAGGFGKYGENGDKTFNMDTLTNEAKLLTSDEINSPWDGKPATVAKGCKDDICQNITITIGSIPDKACQNLIDTLTPENYNVDAKCQSFTYPKT